MAGPLLKVDNCACDGCDGWLAELKLPTVLPHLEATQQSQRGQLHPGVTPHASLTDMSTVVASSP